MLNITETEVWGFKGAMRGMRNPKNSWGRSDSEFVDGEYVVGEADMGLATRLTAAGTEHAKFLRMIHVQMDVKAPLYWWKEFDTYKVGTTANSCSTMHKLTSRPIGKDDFSFDNGLVSEEDTKPIVDACERMRLMYLETKEKEVWRCLIQILPSSYNQLRTIDTNYAVLLSIHSQRKNHKLSEWHTFCEWIETLPRMKEFIEAYEI